MRLNKQSGKVPHKVLYSALSFGIKRYINFRIILLLLDLKRPEATASFEIHLVKIESAEEKDFLRKAFLPASAGTYWIGLNDQMKEGEWIWRDGSLLVNYTN